MKKCIYSILIIFNITILSSCSTNKQDAILGIWRTDSISTYVNGYSRTNNVFDEHWSYFEYQKEGKVFERRKSEFRKYNYQFVSQDSLSYADSTNNTITKYEILHLDPARLVLKKQQNPFLPGNNQELYEIRYFSKIEAMP